MPVDLPVRIHATTIALGNQAALIRGPSGAGKSDLALRCLTTSPSALISAHVRLVSDDYTEIFERESELWTRAPEAISNLLEVRGLGLIKVEALREAKLSLVVDLADADQIARLPDPPLAFELSGLKIPAILLCAHEASAPAKLLMALDYVSRTGNLPSAASPA